MGVIPGTEPDMGLGSCWCGDFDDSSLKKILNMNDERVPIAIVVIGYAGFEPMAPPKKQLMGLLLS